MRKQITRVIALCLCCLFLLPGCRDSPALTRVVYNQLSDNVSDVDSLLDNDLHHEETMDWIDLVEEDSADSTQREENTGLEGDKEELALGAETTYAPESNNPVGVAAVDPAQAAPGQNEDISTDGAAAGGAVSDSGEAVSSGQEPHTDTGGGSTIATDPDGSGETPPDNITPNDRPTDNNGQSGGDRDQDAGKEIVEPDDGEKVDPPEVAGKVAAVGQAAVLVELLGAGARLCAASADFGENTLARAAFADAAPTLLWSEDGTQPLSDGDFAKLLALEPEACFELSGDMTFTETQIRTLKSMGITYVVLPALTTAEGILQAVSLTADVLGDQSDTGGADAPAVAERYLEWYQDTMEELEGTTKNNLSTLFIDGWDSAAATEICWSDPFTSETGDVHWRDSTGTAVVNLKTTDSPLNYFLSAAGVSNRAACTYVGIPQNRDTYTATLASTGSARTLSVTEPTIYVNPLDPLVGNHVYNSWSLSDAGFSSALFVGDGTFTTNHYTGLGNSGFPALVVSSGSVKAAIESSPSWQVFGASGGLGGSGGRNGFVCPEDGYAVATLIKGSYDIYVNPAGLGDWINGSPESVLEAVWSAWKFQGGEDSPYTETWCREKITDFYSTFYRYNLTDSELDAILAGK